LYLLSVDGRTPESFKNHDELENYLTRDRTEDVHQIIFSENTSKQTLRLLDIHLDISQGSWAKVKSRNDFSGFHTPDKTGAWSLLGLKTMWKKPRTDTTAFKTGWRSWIAMRNKKDNTVPDQIEGWQRVEIGVLFSKLQDSWRFLVLIEPGVDELKFCGQSLGCRKEYCEMKPRDSIYTFLRKVDDDNFYDYIAQDIFWSWRQFISDTMSQIHRMREICNRRFLDGSFTLADCWKLYDYSLTLYHLDSVIHLDITKDLDKTNDSVVKDKRIHGIQIEPFRSEQESVHADARRADALINCTIDMMYKSTTVQKAITAEMSNTNLQYLSLTAAFFLPLTAVLSAFAITHDAVMSWKVILAFAVPIASGFLLMIYWILFKPFGVRKDNDGGVFFV